MDQAAGESRDFVPLHLSSLTGSTTLVWWNSVRTVHTEVEIEAEAGFSVIRHHDAMKNPRDNAAHCGDENEGDENIRVANLSFRFSVGRQARAGWRVASFPRSLAR